MAGKHPARVRLTWDTWLLILSMSATSAVLAERLALRERARETQQLREALEHRLTHAQQEETRALHRLDRQISQTRAEADAAVKDAANFRSQVSKVEGQLDTHLKWRKATGNRLDKLERTITHTAKTVDAVDQHVQAVQDVVAPTGPPPERPWWKFWP